MTSDSKGGKKSFYVTVPIYYPNANLHMGHVYTTTLADILARYHRLSGKEVYFLTGSDENTSKVIKSSESEGKSVEKYLDEITSGFKSLFEMINISSSDFIRTTDKEKHWPGVIAMWNALVASGDIYKNSYEGLYCSACEAFYTEKDLIEGKCPFHGTSPEMLKEENYFFRLSKYANQVAEKIKSGEFAILPDSRKNEILAFIERGVEDVSFSRPINVVPHGIPVPGDESQVIYVWCDALTNYISALGYGTDSDVLFKKFWPADVQIMGKDILRFHALIWPAMLLSAGLPLPKNILVHGMITSGGVKMSKSIGNVIDPMEVINEFGVEALRYYVAREISTFEDGDMTLERFKEAYNANLANGLGNLVARVMKMAETHLEKCPLLPEKSIPEDFASAMEQFEIQKAANIVWQKIQDLDSKIQATEPFKLVKSDLEKGRQIISELVIDLYTVGRMLNPIMPNTSEAIKYAVKSNISPINLFPRKD